MHMCICMYTHRHKTFFKFVAQATGMLPTRRAAFHELGLLTKNQKNPNTPTRKKRRKDSNLHNYRAITGKCLYLCYQPPQALLPNSNLESYVIVIITVVHPTYVSNLQCIIMGLHK